MTTRAQQQQAQRIEFQKRVILHHNWATCLNCEYWDAAKEHCEKFDAKPPLEVVVVGCNDWIEDIPF